MLLADGPPHYNPPVHRCIFHVDLDAFFVSVEQLYEPGLKGKPVIVGGERGSRGVVSAASYEARRFGVHSAMPLVTAQRLCPSAIFVPVHFERYSRASRQFMDLLLTISNTIEPGGIDEAFVDVSDVTEDFDDAEDLARNLKQRVRDELELVASVGAAPCKTVAKVASDHDKPDGLVVIRPGEEAAFLAPLDIRVMPGVGPRTTTALHDIGIETLGQLANTQDSLLNSKLGRYGSVLKRHAQGIDTSRVEPRGEPKSMSRETTFSTDTRDLAFLEETLYSMCRQVSNDLRSHQKQASTVTLKLRYEDFTTFTRQQSLRMETSEADELHGAATHLLRQLLSGEDRRVRLIGVRASRLSGPDRQLDMFAPETGRIQALDKAIAHIRRRYGENAIRPGRR
ncbi:MAG: DNA polymerase IV [Chloroflexota bacterium]